MTHYDDPLAWAEFYGLDIPPGQFKALYLFGCNPEVEEVILAQGGGPGLKIFDDRVEKSLRPCRPWAEGFKEIRDGCARTVWVACGVASTPKARWRAISRIQKELDEASGWSWTNVVASSAHVGNGAVLGRGVLVLDMAYVGPLAQIEDFGVLLPGAKIYHSARLGTGSILVGGSTVLGRASIDKCSRVCANAIVLPSARVGAGQTIGAGLTAARLGADELEFPHLSERDEA
jgi:hypothetical protein